MTVLNQSTAIEKRRVGEYGHFVMPISQLFDDVGEFLDDQKIKSFLPEIVFIERADQGVHPEEAAILYGLVRALKPNVTLETGTCEGYSSAEIARALSKNETGHLFTVDVEHNSGSRIPQSLLEFITFFRGQSSLTLKSFFQNRPIDIFFHDSLHTYSHTMQELIGFAPVLKENAIILCHDAKMDYLAEYGVGQAVREFAEALKLPYRILDTTCGLALIRWSTKASGDDFARLKRQHQNYDRKKRINGFVDRAFFRFKRVIGLMDDNS